MPLAVQQYHADAEANARRRGGYERNVLQALTGRVVKLKPVGQRSALKVLGSCPDTMALIITDGTKRSDGSGSQL